jgi:putative tricarboxylic transport membrane protein
LRGHLIAEQRRVPGAEVGGVGREDVGPCAACRDLGGLGFEACTHLEQRVDVAVGHVGDDKTASEPVVEQPLGDQATEGLANRRARHPDSLGLLDFEQRGARPEFAVEDLRPQALVGSARRTRRLGRHGRSVYTGIRASTNTWWFALAIAPIRALCIRSRHRHRRHLSEECPMRTPRLLTATLALALALGGCSAKSESGGDEQGGGDFKALSRVEIIAPAAPGSGWDQTARAVQEALQADGLARSAEVKNVPGASGTVALAQVAPQKGKADLLVASGLAMMSGIITNGTDVTLDDLTPIARVVGEYEVIVVPKNVPFNNADELFAAIKADPKSVAIAGGSAGSADHIFIGLLAKHYGVKPADVNYVPYSGGGEATTALLGGNVQAGVAGLNEFAEQIKNGNLKGLLISSTDQIGDVTFAQTAAQIDPGLEFQNWRSIMAPGGIDDALKTQYVEAMTRMHDSSNWTETVKKNGWNDNFLAGDEFAAWLKEENARVQAVLSDLGLAKSAG